MRVTGEPMRIYLRYLGQRLAQFAIVVFIGVNLTYLITHMTPIDPVEQSIAAVTSFGNTAPEAIAMMRASLRELYGLTGTPLEQYVNFWRRIAVLDFGPSLSAFPTPVSVLIARALPWTIGLLLRRHPHHLDARQPARRPCGLLPRQ